MTKTVKRVIVVILLILTVLLVGCLIFTGNRLANYPPNMDCYWGGRFEGKDNTIVAFTDDLVWYGTDNNEVILMEVINYDDGVISVKKGETIYQFVAIDADTLYDETTKTLLTRRTDYDEFT